jgi:bifunctional DNA-binding transcriptional regulator/antitoxin component of YhaV-PrlF toxin-antitoxin module
MSFDTARWRRQYLLNESSKTEALAREIDSILEKYDPEIGISYDVFAQAVAEVLKGFDDDPNSGYGTHNYEPFVKELRRALGI